MSMVSLPGLRSPGVGNLNDAGQSNRLVVAPFSVARHDQHDDHVEAEMESAYESAEAHRAMQTRASFINKESSPRRSLLRDMLNISPIITDGAAAIIDDSFNKCFTQVAPDPWNWNAYLWPQWLFGTLLRHCILFPLRLVMLLLCNFVFISGFFVIGMLYKPGPRRKQLEIAVIQLTCGAWLMAWNAVVKYHGPKPTPGANRVWVSNHTSMIDYTILCAFSPFSVIMQLHGGWVKFLQTRILVSLGCLWFNRTDLKDRHVVADRMKAHVSNPDAVPLLIFPEGTCVNNEYCVMFKRGAFDLGATVCPVAIKYNKIFVDAFWNSRRQSFGQHIYRLMTSWALVCDVWFLEPQTKQPGESADEFAGRVQKMIADTAGLKVVPWDGYLKYYNLGQAKPGLVEKRRKVVADILKGYLSHPNDEGPAPASDGPVFGKKDL